MTDTIEERLKAIDVKIADAKDRESRIKGKLDELDLEKGRVLEGFQKIGVKPQEAKAKREELEAQIEGWLDEAEKTVQASQAATDGT